MDAFYASIEQRDNPGYRGKPVAVGGSPERRGVVAAASYEARKYGIHSAMPAKRALSLCRDLILVQPNFEKYTAVSEELISYYRDYTDLIEPVSLDECYLDVTRNKKGIEIATEIALLLKERIKKEMNLTASAGVAPNKLLAKIASDINKPDGITVIRPHQIEEFMKDLEVKKIWGVGKVTQERLKAMDVLTCGELQRFSADELVKHFGKYGTALYYFARGVDDRPVVAEREVRSVGSEITFSEDYLDLEIIKEALYNETGHVCRRLQKNNLKGRTVTLKIKYDDFTQITRSKTIDHLTDDLDEIFSIAAELLFKTEAGSRKVRLVGASVSRFDINGKEADCLLFK